MTAASALFAQRGGIGCGAVARHSPPGGCRVPCRAARFSGAFQTGTSRTNGALRHAAARALAGVAALWVAAGAAAGPATFRVEPEFTSTEFAVRQFGIAKQHGRFERTRGAIVLDPAHGGGSVDFIIDTASVATGWGLRDDFLRGEAMFDARQFPAIRFHSTRLAYRSAQLVAIDGEVELRGITRPVRLEVTRIACATDPVAGREGCGASVATRISRAEFGMTYAYPLVGDEIELTFAIRALRVADDAETEPP